MASSGGCAADCYEAVWVDEKRGRICQATKHLKAGTLVINDKPAVAVVLDSVRLSHCFGCQQPVLSNPTRCPGCGNAVFCRSCEGTGTGRLTIAKRLHTAVCPAYTRIYSDEFAGSGDTSYLRMALHLAVLRARLHESNMGSTANETDGPGDVIGANDDQELEYLSAIIAAVADLEEHNHQLPQRALAGLLDTAHAVRVLVPAAARASLEATMHDLGVIYTNSMTIGRVAIDPCDVEAHSARGGLGAHAALFAPCGLALPVSAAMLNHSCAPNCHWCVHNGRVCVRTLKAIDSGEELSISYVHAGGATDVRRTLLRRSFHFDCCCIRCARPLQQTLPEDVRAAGLRLHRYAAHETDDDDISGFILPVLNCDMDEDSDSDSGNGSARTRTQTGQWLRVYTSPLRCIPCNSMETAAACAASRAEEQVHAILAGLDRTDISNGCYASDARENIRMLRSQLQQLQAANFKCSRYLHSLHTLAAEVSSRIVSVAMCLVAATDFDLRYASSLPILRLAEEHARRTFLSLQVSQGHSVWAGVAGARLAIVLLSLRAYRDCARKRKRGQEDTCVDSDAEIAVLLKQACDRLTTGLGPKHPATRTAKQNLQRI